MIKRHYAEDKEDALENAKKLLYVMIIAAVISWAGPELAGITTEKTDVGRGSGTGAIAEIHKAVDEFHTLLVDLVDVMKVLLLVGVLGSIAFLTVRRH